MKRLLAQGLLAAAALSAGATLVAAMFAWDPKDLETPEAAPPPPTTVKLPDPPAKEEPPPPPEAPQPAPLLASLAPESFSNSVPDLGGGIGFGSGGSGPAIGGGGGFGAEAGQLVQSQAAVDRPPRAVLRPAPDYPPEARSRGVSGYVVVRVLVGASGAVERTEIEDSEPKGFFDQAALKALRAWKFEPAVVRGLTASAWTTQRIRFELN